MPTFRERLSDVVGGSELRERKIQELESLTDLALKAYTEGPFILSQDRVLEQLGEVDTQLVDYWLRMRGYELLGGLGKRTQVEESDRLAAVEESRWMFRTEVLVGRSVRLFTDFGFGQTVSIIPLDDKAKPIWEEFWTARRNSPLLKQRKIQNMSNDLVIDGELFFSFSASAADGETTIRRVFTEEIKEIIYENDDPDVPLFYVRNTDDGLIYYPDWQATEEMLSTVEIPEGIERADKMVNDDRPAVEIAGEEQPGTHVVMMHAAYQEIDGRGWPVFHSSFPWARTYRNFLGDRATVARAVAMFVDKIKHTGGSRATDMLMTQIQSSLTQAASRVETNPPAAAGSTWIENEEATRSRQSLTTGAGDARMDGMMFLGQFSAGTGIPLHYLGRPDSMQNRAVAQDTAKPWGEQMQRYQNFWADVFKDMVEIVLRMAETFTNVGEFETVDADIAMENPVYLDQDDIARIISVIDTATTNGTLDFDTGMRSLEKLVALSLQSFGIRPETTIIKPDGEEPASRDEPGIEAWSVVGSDTWDLPKRAGSGKPALMSEVGGVGVFRVNVRAAVRGLWTGSLDFSGYIITMTLAIEKAFTEAWKEGAAECGIEPDEMTDAETAALRQVINSNLAYVNGFGIDIQSGSKANKGKLTPLFTRSESWINRYNDVKNQAKVMTCADKKLAWRLGPTEHCPDCLNYSNRIYRASTWEKHSVRPQMETLNCKGFRCQCSLNPTDERATPGFPPQPKG